MDKRNSTAGSEASQLDQQSPASAALKTAGLYALFGVIWIIGSDMAVETILPGQQATFSTQTLKGLLYIGATTLLVYWLARRALAGAQARRVQSRLLRTREHLERVLDSVGDAVLLIDPADRTILLCNPTAERVFGYRAEEMLGASTEILHLDGNSFDGFGAMSEAVLNKGEAFRGEFVMKRKDGASFEAEITVSMLQDGLEWRQSAVSVIRDISERKRAEARLRESEEQYRLLAENTLDVIWAMDMDFVFTYVNPAAEQLTGYSPEEHIGTHLSDHLKPEDVGKASELIQEQIAKGPGAPGVVLSLQQVRKDGTPITIEVHGRVIFDASGAPTAIQGVTRDITERISLEEQLRQAQKMEAVGRLAGGIAHDFNNALSVILGYSELALRELDESHPLYDNLHAIQKAGQHSAELTHQLLAFARKQDVRPETLNVNGAVQSILKMLERLIGEDVALRWQPETELPRVRIDHGQLEQVLANLVVNARDAVSGVGTVTIETASVFLDEALHGCSPGRYVVLSVSDSGVGMDKETLARAFEPFFTTKPEGAGTGLGLATVYGIVTHNGGRIEVSSEPGAGATFRIYLPALADAASESRQRPRTSHESGAETILLVEDEAPVLNLVRSYLERLGYAVKAANSPSQALELACESKAAIHLLLTDIVMPGRNGRELYAELKALQPDLKCLFMSGYTDGALEARDGFTMDGTHFLQKPFTLGVLAAKVREALEASSSPVTAPSAPPRSGG